MKFNWRANWEILLVLVIIVVGIVITTIAAIRNKDKHLLALPEETDFGHLLSAGANGGAGLSETNGSVPEQQSNMQLQTSSGQSEDEAAITSGMRRPPSPLSNNKPSRASSFNSATGRDHQNHQQQQHNMSHSRHAHNFHHHEAHRHPSSTKFDDGLDYGRPTISALNEQPVTTGSARFNYGTGQDVYEPSSTESSPINQAAFLGVQSGDSILAQNQRQSHGARRQQQTNRTTQSLINNDESYADPMTESVDLIDDIHTTRSSLAGTGTETITGAAGSPNSNQKPNQSPTSATMQATQTIDQAAPGGAISSLALHGPYGLMNSNQLDQILVNSISGNTNKAQSQGSLLDPVDLISPYARIPTNSTDAFLRDYNLANTLSTLNSNSSSNQQFQQQLMNSAMLANLLGSLPGQSVGSEPQGSDLFNVANQASSQQHPTTTASPIGHHRAFSSLLPISMLLGDLLKLTRPGSASEAARSPGSAAHSGILQQSRLPGPLLSLLQGIAPSVANGMGIGGGEQMPFSNHDASESSQHYQRVSMSPTDIHSILTRSLTSSGVLPAFPPPKGAAPSWIPPTAGGSPDYNTAANSNADFVIKNVAGFVRTMGIQPQQSQSSDQQATGPSNHQQSSYPQQQGQQQYDLSYQRQSSGTSQFYPHVSGDPGAQIQATPLASQQQPQQIYQQQAQQQQQLQSGPQEQLTSMPLDQALTQTAVNNGAVERPNWAAQTNGVGQQDGSRAARPMFKPAPVMAGQQSNVAQDFTASFMSYPVQGSNNNNNIGAQQNQKPAFSGNNNALGVHHAPASAAASFNSAGAVFSSRPMPSPSEVPVPLGYSPPPAQVASMAPTQQANQMTLRSAANKQLASNAAQQQATIMRPTQQQQQQQHHHQQQQQMNNQAGKALSRRRRSPIENARESDRVDEVMSSKYGSSDDDEDDSDSRPISVVRLDGRPMDSGRVRGFPLPIKAGSSLDSVTSDGHLTDEQEPTGSSKSQDRQVAQSQRSANHLLEAKKDRYHHHHHHQLGSGRFEESQSTQPESARSPRARSKQSLDESGSHHHQSRPWKYGDNKKQKDDGGESKRSNKHHHRQAAQLDTASSGLMSKLLGTASTNDELDEEIDDEEDPANEKRKEEMEDAEFGIVNDERQNRPPDVGGTSEGGANGGPQAQTDSKLSADQAGDSGLGSGSTDNQSYMRRNQQRSDIEFYGHPGEETRQLKYGILGSGNYEVVNGGIYPETDESTAAVNSVANYVRKPSALLGALPKLLGASEPVGSPQSAFMPGGRVGGFLRGASNTNPDELVNLMGQDEPGKEALSSPLLELIEANSGQLFDPNLIAQLGSSGSSARSTHASKESIRSSLLNNAEENLGGKTRKGPKEENKMSAFKRFKSKSGQKLELETPYEENEDNANAEKTKPLKGGHRLAPRKEQLTGNKLDQQQSSISSSRPQGTNQFNSYQILPSKKVTIFSDQDLDSAPSELRGRRRFY